MSAQKSELRKISELNMYRINIILLEKRDRSGPHHDFFFYCRKKVLFPESHPES